MDIDTTAPIISMTHRPDGTRRRTVLRDGDAPTEEDRVRTDAIRLADSLPSGVSDSDHFEASCKSSGSFRNKVFVAYKVELLMRRDASTGAGEGEPNG